MSDEKKRSKAQDVAEMLARELVPGARGTPPPDPAVSLRIRLREAEADATKFRNALLKVRALAAEAGWALFEEHPDDAAGKLAEAHIVMDQAFDGTDDE